MATQFAADVIAGGEPAITEMVTEGREETLHLEFKTLSSGATLNRDDRKMIAKAICGFANAEGGLLILGIETKKIDGVDTAFKKQPIKNLDRIRRRIAAALPELLSPQHNGLTLTAVANPRG
jgi:predicted HTH transcriptional regulator